MSNFWNTNPADLTSRLGRIELYQQTILRAVNSTQAKVDKIMSALDDLKAALSGLTDAVAADVAEIEVLLGKITAPGTSDADVAAAVAAISDLTKSLNDEVEKAKAAAP